MQTYRELGVSDQQRPAPMTTPSRNGDATNGSLDSHAGPGPGSKADPVVLACHLVDFWTNICLCHSLIVEEAEDEGPPIYQASSSNTCYIPQLFLDHSAVCVKRHLP